MSFLPFIPDNSPFSLEQRAWLNGYFASLFGGSEAPGGGMAASAEPAAPPLTIAVLYGSQTGTAEACAKQVGKAIKKLGYLANVTCLESYTVEQLANEKMVLLLTSTYGEGDMPDNAESFWQALKADSAPKLENLSYSVLGFGDTNYADTFCDAAKHFDARLEELRATRLVDRVDCDVDYDTPFEGWLEASTAAIKDTFGEPGAASAAPSGAPVAQPSATSGSGATSASPAPGWEPVVLEGPLYHRKNPFPATLVENRPLNADGSAKDTRHIAISLHGSDLEYEAGDALAVVPRNCAELVDALIDALGCSGFEIVELEDESPTPLRHALATRFEISEVPKALLDLITEKLGGKSFMALLNGSTPADGQLSTYLYGRDIIDVLKEFKNVKITPQEFIECLKKLQPRLYSISSSPKAHPGEVHLTIGTVRYEAFGRSKKGVCSTFLADRVCSNTPVHVYIQKNEAFRLPESPDVPVIMIGPGTGIAPFRAFLEERRETGASGKNWLFFGDQKRSYDFLYEQQLNELQEAGILSRLDLAFSRDGDEKVYVQHRMYQQREEIYKWLEEGACVYVCGDANRMAKDVDNMLQTIIKEAGQLDDDGAGAYMQALKKQKRYLRDVY